MNQPTLDELATEEEAGGSRKMDQELKVMGALLRSLDQLDEKARPRVVAWLYAREAECK